MEQQKFLVEKELRIAVIDRLIAASAVDKSHAIENALERWRAIPRKTQSA
jgi:hypothetical protein